MKAVKMNVLTASGLAALLIAFAAPALADDPIHFIGTASGTGSAAATDITNPAKWGDGVTPLSSESDYIIDNGKYCGFGGSGTFPGKSLTLGVVGGNSGYMEALSSGGTFNFGTLILNKGQIYHKIKSSTTKIDADVTVNATIGSPYTIQMGGASGSRIEFLGAFHGSGGLIVKQSSQATDYMIARFRGDMSDFTGKISAGPASTAANVKYGSPILFDAVSVGGEIALNPCGIIGACGVSDYVGEFSTKRLSFSDGSIYRFSVNDTTGSTIRVTETLTMPASGKVVLDAMALPDNCVNGGRYPILIVPAGTGLSKDSFELKAVKTTKTNEITGKLAACTLEVDSSAEDCETLYLVMEKYTSHDGSSDPWGKSSWLAAYSTHWSGVAAGTALDPDMTYIHWRTGMTSPSSNVTFGGKRLVLCGRELLLAGDIVVDDFVMMNAPEVRFWSQSGAHVGGNICLTNPATATAAQFKGARTFSNYVDARLYGPGNLSLIGSNERSANDNPSTTYYLTGINTAFSGKINVTNVENDPATNTTLRISDVRQLGGARSEFAYNALSLSNWSRLRADASLNLNEPTRGVYFLGGNYVNVYAAANTLTLSTQTTLAGTLVKEGAGTLALGGTLKFTSAQSDTPVAGTNILRVAAGRIRPASKTGADGLAISFASGTGIRLAPLSETDADVVRYGLYDVKWATPFDLSATEGKLDVALDLPADRREMPDTMSFGVCTVPAAAADALDGNIVLPGVKGRKLQLEPVDNGDGTVTFTATYLKNGLYVILL